jgi:hypothetical protein
VAVVVGRSLLVAAQEEARITHTSIVTIEIANSIGGFKITAPSEVLLHYNDTRELRQRVCEIGMVVESQHDIMIIRREKEGIKITWSF